MDSLPQCTHEHLVHHALPDTESSVCAGKNWVDPPKRERKRQVNYAENEYFRNALKAPGRAPGGPRLPKMPALQDFQFYNLPRLTEIYDQEQAYELWKHSQGQKEAAVRSQVQPDHHPQLGRVPSDHGRWGHHVTGHYIAVSLVFYTHLVGITIDNRHLGSGQSLDRGQMA